jgi:DNA repair ATPase RecN
MKPDISTVRVSNLKKLNGSKIYDYIKTSCNNCGQYAGTFCDSWCFEKQVYVLIEQLAAKDTEIAELKCKNQTIDEALGTETEACDAWQTKYAEQKAISQKLAELQVEDANCSYDLEEDDCEVEGSCIDCWLAWARKEVKG